MATAATTEAKETECSICHEEFTIPKLLSCGHLLCRHCLLSLVNAHHNALCPLCRHLIINPDTHKSQSLEDIVDTFPTDVGMKIWVENEQLLKKDHKCQSCVTQAASSLCLQCRDFLCSSCTAMHGRLSVSRHHHVESLSSLTAEKLAASYSTPCQQHPQELSRLYCATHQASICLLCATSKHRNCPDVKDLEERGEETQVLLKEVATMMITQEAKLDQAIQELDDLLQEEEKKEQAAVAEIDNVFDQIESTVKKHRLQVKELALSRFSHSKKSIQEGRTHLLQKRGIATMRRKVAERGQRVAAAGDVCEMADALKKQADDFKSKPLLPTDAKVIDTATFEMNSENPVSNVEKALQELVQVKVSPAYVADQIPPFSFHDNCGKNIVLSNNQWTAERKGRGYYDGIVVSCQPMVPHWLYEVHLDEKDADGGYTMMVGAATVDPGSLTLPQDSWGWESAVVFCFNRVQVHGGQTISTKVGAKLRNLPKGSRVGLMIDDSGHLHLYMDGKDQGQAGTQVSQPCFAFFDVCLNYRKVTALPVTFIGPKKT